MKTITFKNTIVIQHPIEQVFTFIADFKNVPQWNYNVMSVRKLSEKPVDLGTVYHQVRKRDQQDFQVMEYQLNKVIAIKAKPGSKPWFEQRFMFDSVDSGTRIVDTWKLDFGRHVLIPRLWAFRVKFAIAGNLKKLKELLETGQTQLQDGRTVRI